MATTLGRRDGATQNVLSSLDGITLSTDRDRRHKSLQIINTLS
jgi:hypothetical protein